MLRSVLRRGGATARLATWEGGASPRDLLRQRVAERERARRRRRDPGRDEFFVPTPESLAWLDSVSLPMVLTAAAVALFTKLLMMVTLHLLGLVAFSWFLLARVVFYQLKVPCISLNALTSSELFGEFACVHDGPWRAL